jgi:Rod binding domain-containing protein
MDGYSRLERTTLHPVDPSQQVRSEARKVADQFEGVMLRSMVAAMRESAKIDDESGGMFGSGPGADTYGDWFDENVTNELSHSGKVGIADVLMREFERWKQIPPDQRAPGLLQVDRDVLQRHDLPLRGMTLPGSALGAGTPTAGFGGTTVQGGLDVAA